MKYEFIPKPLDAYKDEVKAEVDAVVEKLRLRFVTPGSAQAMVYVEKEAEARAFSAGSTEAIPHITLEAEETGQSVTQLASIVVMMADRWKLVSARLEAKRQGVKKQISEATDHSGVTLAAKVDWEAVING